MCVCVELEGVEGADAVCSCMRRMGRLIGRQIRSRKWCSGALGALREQEETLMLARSLRNRMYQQRAVTYAIIAVLVALM